MTRLPNFLYVGPDKAGSSWLHEVLMEHPQIYMTPAKDLYFFDRYFDKGIDWYAAHFAKASARDSIIGEVCQDYLSHPLAAERIQSVLVNARVMVTLRDPVERAFSSYLYMLKMGQRPGTFREALHTRSELLDHGRYASGLDRFADRLGDDNVYVAMFDDLGTDPQKFIADLLQWLRLDPFELNEALLATRLPASEARSPLAARMARRAADFTREHVGAEVVGRVKRAPVIHTLLYRPLESKPALEAADVELIREELDAEMARVEQRFNVDVRRRWNWDVV